jgi:hypothetical protein
MRNTLKFFALAASIGLAGIATQGCDAPAAPQPCVQAPAAAQPQPDKVSASDMQLMTAASAKTFRLNKERLIFSGDGSPLYATHGSVRNPLGRDISMARVRVTIYDAQGTATDSKNVDVADIPANSAKAVTLQRMQDLFALPKGKFSWTVEVVSATYK